MVSMRALRINYILLTSMLIILLLSITQPISASMNYKYPITIYGIKGVIEDAVDNGIPVIKKYFILDNLETIETNGYIVFKFNGVDGYLNEPGKPALPYSLYILRLPRNVEIEYVGAVNVKYDVIKVKEQVKPAQPPIPYMPEYKRFLEKLGWDKKPYLDNNVYGVDKFYPGTLVKYYIGRSRDTTLVYIWFYPIQYNAFRNEAIIIREADIIVGYKEKELVNTYNALPSYIANAKYIIITSHDLVDKAKKLAQYYNNTGITTVVITTDWIYKHYSPAENITFYPGFYNPMIMGRGNYSDPYYAMLVAKYNYTLALKIISFLREIVSGSNVTHILLFGPSDKVPPSFYYQSMYLYWYDPWNGWVPTDIFYASPDYDLIPDLAVGRIPVADQDEAETVVDKIISWYNAIDSDNTWFRKIVLSGGYPFGMLPMFGELYVSRMIHDGVVDRLEPTPLYRTDKTYNRDAILNALTGNIGWMYVLAHGSGDAWSDRYYDENLDIMTWEILASKYDLMYMPSNTRVPIVLSVACMNAAWDTEILTPTYFMPPSFGKALLLSPAGGISYIGSSRIAFSSLMFIFNNGVMDVTDYGAPYYLRLVLEAYNDAVGDTITLGDIVKEGLTRYASLLGSYMVDTSIVYTTIMEFTPMLGDPYLILPVYDKIDRPRISQVTVVNALPENMVSATIVGGYYSNGTIPYIPYQAGMIELNATITSYIGNITVCVDRLYGSYGMLYGHKRRLETSEPVVNGVSTPSIPLTRNISGYILVHMRVGVDEIRLMIISYGLVVYPSIASSGSQVYIEGAGLDVLAPPGTQCMVSFAGTFIGYVTTTEEGIEKTPILIPWAEPGRYNITVYVVQQQYYGGGYTQELPPAYATIDVTLSSSLSSILSSLDELHNMVIVIDNNTATITAEVRNTRLTLTSEIDNLATLLKDLNATVIDIIGYEGDHVIAVVKDENNKTIALINATKSNLEELISMLKNSVDTNKQKIEDVASKVSDLSDKLSKIEDKVSDASETVSSTYGIEIATLILVLIAAALTGYTAIKR